MRRDADPPGSGLRRAVGSMSSSSIGEQRLTAVARQKRTSAAQLGTHPKVYILRISYESRVVARAAAGSADVPALFLTPARVFGSFPASLRSATGGAGTPLFRVWFWAIVAAAADGRRRR